MSSLYFITIVDIYLTLNRICNNKSNHNVYFITFSRQSAYRGNPGKTGEVTFRCS